MNLSPTSIAAAKGLVAFIYAEPVANNPNAFVPIPVVAMPLFAGLPRKEPEFAPADKVQTPKPEPRLDPFVQEE